MKKKWIAALLTVAMTAAMLTGCGGKAAEESDTNAKTESGTDKDKKQEQKDEPADSGDGEADLADITISYWSMANLPEEKDLVEDAINEITEEEIGVTVHLNIMDSGTYIPNGAMANGVANGEDFDLVLTAPALSGHYRTMQANGMLMPLNDLLKEYAPELLSEIPAEFLKATTAEGEVYAIPSYGNKINNQYWVCRKSVLEGAGIDITKVTNMQTLEEALVKIKEAFPDMNPLSGNSLSQNITYPGFAMTTTDLQCWDTLGETTAVAAVVNYDDEALNAVSRYETDDFKADMEILKKWYDMGLLDKDTPTDTATSNTLEEKANAASTVYVGRFYNVPTLVKSDEVEWAKLSSGTVSTGAIQQFTWAVPVSCDEPEAAVKFLNMLYTDERIVNLIDFGIEGKHYVKSDDGTLTFPEGVTQENSGYYMGNGFIELVGNVFLAQPWEGSDPDSQKQAKQEMDDAVYSPLTGFSLEINDTVSDIYAQLCSIANQEYGPALFCGSAPDGYYEEFIEKMKAAGLQQYLDEANRQIQEWAAAQK